MRGEQKPLVIIPFLISLSIYFGVIFGVFYYLNYNEELVKKYTSKKDNFLEVSIVKNKKKEVVPEKAQVKDEKKIEKKPNKGSPKKVEQKTSRKQSTNVKDLFGKIKTKDINLSKPIPISNKSLTKISRLKPKVIKKPKKSKKAKKLANSLNLSSAPKLSASSSIGEYDKFKGEIQEMLDGFWNQTVGTQSGAEANVKVLIDENGRFSYDIVNFSYNNDFNTKLREFLEDMQNVQFPKNVDRVPPLTIKFKDHKE